MHTFKFEYLRMLKTRYTHLCLSTLGISSSGANPTLGHSCPNEFTPDSPNLRSVPGGEKADVGWFQVSLNNAGPRECRSPSSPLPVPRLAMDGSIQSTVVVQLWVSPGSMPKPAEPSGADDLR